MKITFTPTDYISYLYGEASVKENYLIEEHLSDDWSALHEFRQIEKVKNELDDLLIGPSQNVCDEIMNFASA
jgi:hypothetical protein